MAVKAIGNDLVDVARLGASLARYGERIKQRLFTEEERRYCESKATPAVHYAGRFAAKEAVLKVLGSGFVNGVGLEDGATFRDIELRRRPSGAPYVELRGPLADRARQAGIEEILVTVTHTREHAMAVALGQGAE
ncbi:MAG: holo-ACP synthase [Planctomycetota bacterium]